MTERWYPEALGDLRTFIANGHGEDHYREFKVALPSNERIARQMAGFAIDGGDIYVGVKEQDTGFAIAPVELVGLPEKVEQIALTRIDPPLRVATHTLRDQDDRSEGVLRIAVDPSPEAPHQVSGTYYKRSGKQTLPMPDPEIERLIRVRRTTLASITAALEETLEGKPLRDDGQAHIVGLARPIGASEEEFYESVGGAGRDQWTRFLNDVLLRGAKRMEHSMAAGSRHYWDFLSAPEMIEITPGPGWRFGRRDTRIVCDARVENDGAFVYRSNRAGGGPPESLLVLENIVGACLDMLVLMQSIARQTGRRRSWDIAFDVQGAEGLRAHIYAAHPFPDARYTRAKRVSYLQLTERPWDVARDLVHGFTEGCGVTFAQIATYMGHAPEEDPLQ